ncbi:MAG: HAMP domain-containing sensor histidine kinase [Elusimicrobiota bacterium]|jgi:signal transduction histidine kinase
MKAAQGFGRRLRALERLTYFLPLVPFITDVIEKGGLPRQPRDLLTESVAAVGIIGFILLMRRTRKHIERVDSLRQGLSEVAVHDLKNPLTSVIAAVSAAIDESEDARRRRLLQLALSSAKRQSQLIDTLMEIDRLENDQLPLRKGSLRLQALIEDSLAEVRPVADERGVELSFLSPAETEDFCADEDLIKRVLANLLQNALKYVPDGGSVSVRAVHQDRAVAFEVADTGPGIPAEQIGRLFGKFYRVEGRDQSKRRGTGLGLYFCRLVVEAHGGTIHADNKPSGGLSVTFSIPQ